MNDKKPTLLHKLTLQNFRFFQTENNVFEFDTDVYFTVCFSVPFC